MIEVKLLKDFGVVRETLSRMGMQKLNTDDGVPELYPSCVLYFDKGRYYIAHFKEMFGLEGKPSNMTVEDAQRRDNIVNMLERWGIVEAIDEIEEYDPTVRFRIVPYKEKDKWRIVEKFDVRKMKQRKRQKGDQNVA